MNAFRTLDKFSELGGLTLINAHTPPHERGATLSAVYLISYVFMGLIAFSIGLIATAHGLELALDLNAPAGAFLSVLAAVLSMAVTVIDRRPASATGLRRSAKPTT